MFDHMRNVPAELYEKLRSKLEHIPSSSWDIEYGGKFHGAESLTFGLAQELHGKWYTNLQRVSPQSTFA